MTVIPNQTPKWRDRLTVAAQCAALISCLVVMISCALVATMVYLTWTNMQRQTHQPPSISAVQ